MVNADTIKNTLISLSIKQYTAVKILLSFQLKEGGSSSTRFLLLFHEQGRRDPVTCLKVIGKRHPMAAQHSCASASPSSAPASQSMSQTRLAQTAELRICQNNYFSNKSILQKASHFFYAIALWLD